MAILDDEGRVTDVYAAHDSGKVVNPVSIQGQIEGRCTHGNGLCLNRGLPLKGLCAYCEIGYLGPSACKPDSEHPCHLCGKDTPLPFAHGAKGIGEIASIPIAPAIANAYYAFDHEFRTKLPLEGTFYRKKK